VSSYQKGINRLLEHKSNFETLIIDYLLAVNSKYRSNMFPTPQIAKILLEKLKMKKTQFPILHKIVRTLLADWEKQGLCEYVTTTKSGRNRRTKFIYRFTPDNFQYLKGRYISSSIDAIEQHPPEHEERLVFDTMKTREAILDDRLNEIRETMEDLDTTDADPEDVDAWEDAEEEEEIIDDEIGKSE
jgi:hypothetical protein